MPFNICKLLLNFKIYTIVTSAQDLAILGIITKLHEWPNK